MDNMKICENHKEYQQIFYLEKMLKEAGYPYYFNFNEDYPEIIWGKYKMRIDIEQRAGFKKPMLEIFCDGGLLKLCDYRLRQTQETTTGKFFEGLTAEDAMHTIEKIFNISTQ